MALVADWDMSGDSDPQFALADATNVGRFINSSTPNHTIAEVWARDTTRRRHGTYGIRVTGFRDGYGANSSSDLDVRVYVKPFGANPLIVHGSEEWFGWSWYFPTNYTGTGSWGSIMESFTATNRTLWPTYGHGSWDAQLTDRLRFYLRLGQLPSPPGATGPAPGTYNPYVSPSFTADSGYWANPQNVLGTGGVKPFTKGVWHDFYWHAVWSAGRYDGMTYYVDFVGGQYVTSPSTAVWAAGNDPTPVWEIYHREEGGSFNKIYSNQGDGSALINAPLWHGRPHPTFYWNYRNGVPSLGGGRAVYQVYRGVSAFDLATDVQYWADGFFGRQSQSAVLAEFPSGDVTAPTVSSAEINGASVVLTFSESLDESSIPDESAFAVRVATVARALNNDLTVLGAEVRFTLVSAAASGEAVEFDYTAPGSGKLRDLPLNNVANISAQPISNITIPTTPQLSRITGVAGTSGSGLSGTRLAGTRIS